MATPGRPRRLFFDLWSLIYDLPLVQRAVYHPAHHVVLTELRPVPGRARVLDLGCGTGELTERLAGEAGAGTVVGADFSLGMLQQAAAKTAGPGWIQADAARLPFRDGSFDAVVSTEAFHWFPDKAVALGELRRVIAAGGRLVVAVVNPRSRAAARLAHAGSVAAGEPATWLTRADMRRAVCDAGFDVVTQRRVHRIGGLAIPTFVTVGVRR